MITICRPLGSRTPCRLPSVAGAGAVAILADRQQPVITNKYNLWYDIVPVSQSESVKRLQYCCTSSSAMSARRQGWKSFACSTVSNTPGSP